MQVSGARWLQTVLGVTPYASTQPSLFAKIKIIFTHTNLNISTWILVAVTAELVLCVTFPHKVKLFCTVNNSRWTVIVISLFSLLLNTIVITTFLDVIFLAEVGTTYCEKFEGSFPVFLKIDLIYGFVLPFVLICIGSIVIVVTIVKSRLPGSAKKTDRTRSVTATVIIINITFIVTTSPYRVFSVVTENQPFNPIEDTLQPLFMYMEELNAVLNFYVYILSGTKFRSDVRELLKLGRSEREQNNIK